jgi:hypothetical protein
MLLRTITGLTVNQKRDLDSRGISKQLLTHWKNGRRLPTEVQTVILADVAGVDRHELQDEIALMRATPEQKTILERAMGKLKAGALASFALALVGVVANVAMTTEAARSTMYIMSTR